MKKDFVRPTLKKYELQQKEKIVSSGIIENGTLSQYWHFIQDKTASGVDVDPLVGDQGCYDSLIATFNTVGKLVDEYTWTEFIHPYQHTENAQHAQYISCTVGFESSIYAPTPTPTGT